METSAPGGNNTPPTPKRPTCTALGAKALYQFLPQPEATADEIAASAELLLFGLAMLMRSVFRKFNVDLAGITPQNCDQLYEAMDEGAKRHWKVIPLSPVSVAKKPQLQLPPGAKE